MELTQKDFEIDGVKYVLTQGNFFESKKEAEKLTALLRGVVDVKLNTNKDGASEGGFALDIKIPEILANITSPEAQGIQDFITSKMQVIKDGEGIPTSKKEELGRHFNQYRSHYYTVIYEGVKFHFLDFLPSGAEWLTNTIKQAINKQTANLT